MPGPSFGGNPHNVASGSALHPVLASSDPPDMDVANPYPEIATFITRLADHHLLRNLAKYIPLFDNLDFYHIDEINNLKTVEALTSLLPDISAGTAAFLLAQTKAEIKRINCAARAPKL
ncbi:hypothetical protein B0H16DRAFT_1731564 [Mycena metata]|uniref:Uncharacterized protein n=1 Tax=Mycena metata TaxID=1033252 RepID=A0AAD7MWA4_9AGAR|nr:hypothetical protein B0H16DRAFT_1731564 [Mycena metata]